jgi:hypothetical protein
MFRVLSLHYGSSKITWNTCNHLDYTCRVPDRTPFEQDTKDKSYDPGYAKRFWRILSQANRVFSEFRSNFIGKVSPVHFFWGAFDLAITRFCKSNGCNNQNSRLVAIRGQEEVQR